MPRGGGIASRSPRWRRSFRTSATTASWPSTRCGDCRRDWPRSIGRWNSLRVCSRLRKNTSRRSRRAWGGAECRATVANAGHGPLAGGLCQAGPAGCAAREDGPLGPRERGGPAVRQGWTGDSVASRRPWPRPGRRPAAWRQETPGGGSAGRHRAGEGLRAEPPCLAAARLVAIAADSQRLVRLPLARGSPALVAGARRTPEGIRGTGQTGQAAEGDRRAVPARWRRRRPDRPRPPVAPGDPRPGPLARPDSRRVGEGRQGARRSSPRSSKPTSLSARWPPSWTRSCTSTSRASCWLRPAWWRLRRILNESYDFRSHVVRPRWSQVLGRASEGVRGTRQTGQAAEDDRRAVPARRRR